MHDATLDPRLDGEDASVPYSLPLEITVTDPEVIAELWEKPEGNARDDFALAALRLGVLALRQARGQLDAATIRHEGERLVSDVHHHLLEHRSHLDQTLNQTLKDYFDPSNGRFNERMERLLKKDGELETLLSRMISSEDSELCRTLTAHLGRESALFKMLSPNESEGILQSLRKCVALELEQQRATVLKEFSLDNQQGALSRLTLQLTENNGQFTKNLKERIEEMRREFSFDDDNSALSRMKKTVDATSATITQHLTLDDDNSALSRLRRELLTLFQTQGEGLARFQEDVKVALETLKARREEAAASTRHGIEFEEVVFELLQHDAQKKGDIATPCGTTTGLLKNCKKGDAVIELGADSSAAGARIVVEAKEDRSYNLKAALAEIDEARKNRGADVGIFVFSSQTAPSGLEPIARYGDDVTVVWDRENPSTDLHLTLALNVARALCTRKASQRESLAVDFTAIDKSLLDISQQVKRQDEINGWAETIKNNSGKIMESLRISREKIQKQVSTLSELIEDMKSICEVERT